MLAIDWLWKNHEWVFSGCGVFVVGGLVAAARLIPFRKSRAVNSSPSVNRIETPIVPAPVPENLSPLASSQDWKLTPEYISEMIDAAPPLGQQQRMRP